MRDGIYFKHKNQQRAGYPAFFLPQKEKIVSNTLAAQ